jgi:hypothetical protein
MSADARHGTESPSADKNLVIVFVNTVCRGTLSSNK